MGNLFFFHWQHKGSKKRQSRHGHDQSQSIPQIFKTIVVLSVITKTCAANLKSFIKIPVSIFLPRQGNASFQTI
jgi:hypothetical protein